MYQPIFTSCLAISALPLKLCSMPRTPLCFLQHIETIAVCVAVVYLNRDIELACKAELHIEPALLRLAWDIPVIIESYLAEQANAVASEQLGERFKLRRLVRTLGRKLLGMDARRSIDMLVRECEIKLAAGRRTVVPAVSTQPTPSSPNARAGTPHAACRSARTVRRTLRRLNAHVYQTASRSYLTRSPSGVSGSRNTTRTVLAGGEYHAVALDSAELCGAEICDDYDLLADELLGRVELRYTRNDLTLFVAEIELQTEKLFSLRYGLCGQNLCRTQLDSREIVDADKSTALGRSLLFDCVAGCIRRGLILCRLLCRSGGSCTLSLCLKLCGKRLLINTREQHLGWSERIARPERTELNGLFIGRELRKNALARIGHKRCEQHRAYTDSLKEIVEYRS